VSGSYRFPAVLAFAKRSYRLSKPLRLSFRLLPLTSPLPTLANKQTLNQSNTDLIFAGERILVGSERLLGTNGEIVHFLIERSSSQIPLLEVLAASQHLRFVLTLDSKDSETVSNSSNPQK